PKSCRHLSTTSPCASVQANFAMLAVAVSNFPSIISSIHSLTNDRWVLVFGCNSANTYLVFWSVSNVVPNNARSFVYVTVISKIPSIPATELSALMSRSRGNSLINILNPLSFSPRMAPLLSKTSSKYSSDVSQECRPILSKLLPRSNPLTGTSTINNVVPLEG